MTRKIAFEELHNFRDFGGYAAAGGRQIASGRFFRSANHANATETDLARLADLNIKAVVDLRRPTERARSPSRRWKDFSALVIENDDHHEGEEGWETFMRASDLSAQSIFDYHIRYYDKGPHLPRHIDLFSRYFEALAKNEGGLLVHCAAGKDRTGMIVALTHTLAGVHRDDIIADYLLTNDPERFEKHAPLWAAAIKQELGRAPEAEAMHIAMGVQAPYLETAFKSIEARYGHVETYLRDVLGVGAEKREKIEKRLFE